MATTIRLSRHGAKKRPFYRIIVTDSRAPRDGRRLDQIGTYDPTRTPSLVQIEQEKLAHWLRRGARPSLTVTKAKPVPICFRHKRRGPSLSLFASQPVSLALVFAIGVFFLLPLAAVGVIEHLAAAPPWQQMAPPALPAEPAPAATALPDLLGNVIEGVIRLGLLVYVLLFVVVAISFRGKGFRIP